MNTTGTQDQRHLSLTLRNLIKRNQTSQRAIAKKIGMDTAKLNRIVLGVYRCDLESLTTIRKAFPSVGDQIEMVRAHALDELGANGLQLILGIKSSKTSPLALSPKTLEVLREIESLPIETQDSALRAITEVAHTLVGFSNASAQFSRKPTR